MRLRGAVTVLLLGLGVPALAVAQSDDRAALRLHAALQAEPFIGAAVSRWTVPSPKTLGILTLVPPTGPGEFVRVRVPIGELIVGAAHKISAATERRREAAARREVEAALAAFAKGRRAP